MMKNKMMRVASVLLVAVLLSTCAISGTFAKYVTSNNASDNARVAKFGVVIQADGSLYGTYYDTTFKPSTTSDAASLWVQSSVVTPDAENVVAPGTQSDKGLYVSLTGTPEVRTQLDVTITCENIFLKAGTYAVMVKAPNVTAESFANATYYTRSTEGAYTKADSFDNANTYYTMQGEITLNDNYYPVVYKADLTNGDTTEDSLAAIAADYAQKLNGGVAVNAAEGADRKVVGTDTKITYTVTETYNPNKNYSDLNVAGENLTWAWAIDGNDGADTILGQLQAKLTPATGDIVNEVVKITTSGEGESATKTIAAPTEHTDYNLETAFSIKITVTQVGSTDAAVTEAPTQEPT